MKLQTIKLILRISKNSTGLTTTSKQMFEQFKPNEDINRINFRNAFSRPI